MPCMISTKLHLGVSKNRGTPKSSILIPNTAYKPSGNGLHSSNRFLEAATKAAKERTPSVRLHGREFHEATEMYTSGQISIIPKPELRGFLGDSLTKPPFGLLTIGFP